MQFRQDIEGNGNSRKIILKSKLHFLRSFDKMYLFPNVSFITRRQRERRTITNYNKLFSERFQRGMENIVFYTLL